VSERPERAVRTRRRLFIDLTPLRRSRDLRFLVLGAITCFGLVSWLPGALALLAVAGRADVISAVFRSTIIQLTVPDALRGRLSGLQTAVVAGGPRVGDLESGAVAAAFGDTVSVVSGGLACIAGALALARLLPGFRHQRIPETPAPEHA
jgi:sugar (pentulose or hexulose) kinase